jgi:hypothetical protein
MMSNVRHDVGSDKADTGCEPDATENEDSLEAEIRGQIAAILALYDCLDRLEEFSERLDSYLSGRLLELAPIDHPPQS